MPSFTRLCTGLGFRVHLVVADNPPTSDHCVIHTKPWHVSGVCPRLPPQKLGRDPGACPPRQVPVDHRALCDSRKSQGACLRLPESQPTRPLWLMHTRATLVVFAPDESSLEMTHPPGEACPRPNAKKPGLDPGFLSPNWRANLRSGPESPRRCCRFRRSERLNRRAHHRHRR